MTSQTTSSTFSPVTSNPRSLANASSSVFRIARTHRPDETSPPQPPQTDSASTLTPYTPKPLYTRGTQVPNPSQPNAVQSERAASTGMQERYTASRGHTVHMPHNPSRPPPYIYQRQHEFPPFPPLTQHPVLPFVTTAFSNQPETAPVAPPKARVTLAPRASNTQRHVQSHLSTIPTMDVSRSDPTATFIRPPLVVPLLCNTDQSIRPDVLRGNSSDGDPAPGTPLTYAILHNHRNWFLDADDFHKDNPNRLEYPSDLEPPRGWAPLAECTGPGAAGRCKQAKETREKNSRTKGSYAHGENAATDMTVEYGPSEDCHEKTILRCTFCRREYHGPNAKSMWRRHVYDKHKVPMKNRREGSAGMAPKVPLLKKGKGRVEAPSQNMPHLDQPVAPDTPAPTLDLTDEQHLLRLLERVVSGNLDISLPVSLLTGSSSDGGTDSINLEALALALQKSGISLTLGKSALSPDSDQSHSDGDVAIPCDTRKQSTGPLGQTNWNYAINANEALEIVGNEQLSTPQPSTLNAAQVAAFWVNNSPESDVSAGSLATPRSTSPPPVPYDSRSSQKRKADGGDRSHQPHERVPLKDSTSLARNNYNSNTHVVPGTPRKDTGKQRTSPQTPGTSRMWQPTSPISSPGNPYNPRYLSSTALRARALATTGEESYLTLVLSSPGTASSPVRNTGLVSFTSPFSRRTSPTKIKSGDGVPPRNDPLGILGTSSPHRYPFDFNIEGTPSSPSHIAVFDSIPLELGTLTPAHWTPPSLGPPAPVAEPISRSVSRASSITKRSREADEKGDMVTEDEEENMQLTYPELSSPSKRLKRRVRVGRRPRDDEFDIEAFIDLDDAAPASGSSITASPHKAVVSRGFSKEFGLLSPEEVERITANARGNFEDEARSSKRRKVDRSM